MITAAELNETANSAPSKYNKEEYAKSFIANVDSWNDSLAKNGKKENYGIFDDHVPEEDRQELCQYFRGLGHYVEYSRKSGGNPNAMNLYWGRPSYLSEEVWNSKLANQG